MKNIRNVAVIAHVDHGKTTLIDALLKQTHTFRENQEEMGETRILDKNDQERERGITILAKNCAIEYEGTKINIIDTPGHADFSGEVERTLGMADGALLIIDAQEGPMPQTRFVLKKALELGLKIIVVVNKIDKPYARIPYVLDKTEGLFLDLVKDPEDLNFTVLYAIAKEGKVFDAAPLDISVDGDVTPLLKKIIEVIPAPEEQDDKPFKMLVSSFEHDNHLGRILIGRVHQGIVKIGQKVTIPGKGGTFTIEKIFVSQGLSKEGVDEGGSGNIISIAGVAGAKIGDTVAALGVEDPLPGISLSEPTLHITIGPNSSPFAGREGEYSTSRQLEERLLKEKEKNLSLKIEKREDGKFKVSGRGELHLAVFLEELRRGGYEFEVERPQVLTKEIAGVLSEPVEELNIIVPNEYVGAINQELGRRYAVLISSTPANDKEVEFVYHIPTRALLGLRGYLLTQTKGTLIFNSQLIDYQKMGKPIPRNRSGVLIASEGGPALSYGLKAAEGRGVVFIAPGTEVYQGMIVGKNAKNEDIPINVCKGKKLTNMRSKSSDGVIQLAPPTEITLEKGLEFIDTDELMEITPLSIRLRKKILDETDRRKWERARQHAS